MKKYWAVVLYDDYSNSEWYLYNGLSEEQIDELLEVCSSFYHVEAWGSGEFHIATTAGWNQPQRMSLEELIKKMKSRTA